MKVLTEGTKLPIKLWWDSDDMGQGWDDVLVQFQNLANLPLAEKWICGMPDFHLGYGMPIGGVLATRGGVVPNAVGVDIGCGMIAAETTLEADRFSPDELQALRLAVHDRVPVGMTHHSEKQLMPKRLMGFNDGFGAMKIVPEQYERAHFQIGTLGGGNHFIELQRAPDAKLWIMLHSGSRNVGLKVCNYYSKIARGYMEDFASSVPDLDLAFLPRSVREHDEYLAEMNWCLAFAEESRKMMLDAVLKSLAGFVSAVEVDTFVDTHHNFAAMENHYGKNLLVHRKGAVKAQGLVTIPGSMGTASYICQGLEPKESFNTCSHGAGRVIGRKAANRLYADKHDEAVKMMEHVAFGVRVGDYDELPTCYKNIDAVIQAQSDLVRPVTRLEPLAVVKG